ncbi:MAG: hypothetical protein FWG37_05035 [Clostridia bacterium]|nr:hypothetical protein [Clostridia bacterium]
MKKVLLVRFSLCLLLVLWIPAQSVAEDMPASPDLFMDIWYHVPAGFTEVCPADGEAAVRRYDGPTGSDLHITFSATPIARRLTNGHKTSLALMQQIIGNTVAENGLVLLREPLTFEVDRRIATRFRYALGTDGGSVPEDSMILLHDGHLYIITCRGAAGQEEALEVLADQLFATVTPARGISLEED